MILVMLIENTSINVETNLKEGAYTLVGGCVQGNSSKQSKLKNCDINVKSTAAVASGVKNNTEISLENCNIEVDAIGESSAIYNVSDGTATLTKCKLAIRGTDIGKSIVNEGIMYIDGVQYTE